MTNWKSKVRRALERVPIDGAEEMLTQILSLLDEPQKIHAYIVDKIIAAVPAVPAARYCKRSF